MERGLPPLPPSVIEGVLDVTTLYSITIETRVSDWAAQVCPSHCQEESASQKSPHHKYRPVATVRPFLAKREDEQQEQPSASYLELGENLKNQEAFYEDLEEKDENFSNTDIEKDSRCKSVERSDSCSSSEVDPLHKPQEEERDFLSSSPPLEAPLSSPTVCEPPPSLYQTPSPPPTPLSETKVSSRAAVPHRDKQDPCSRHRIKIQAAVGKPSTSLVYSTKKMEVCQNGGECHDSQQGCAGDFVGDLKENLYKETYITDCLDEFLKELQLTHLRDYLTVLGCTCVRDLKLLEEPELNAIQLISRRRLLKRLESMSFHHEAPPSDCSLEGWLTWYGLTHISGFLSAIGVHTVGDLNYLKEEDLELLKPVTRRRIINLHRK